MSTGTRPLKVLHVANFARGGAVYYNMDRKFSTGLVRCGCFVLDFSYREEARAASLLHSKIGGVGAMNRQLLQAARHLRPDLLLLGHAELVRPETLGILRAELPQMRVAQWWVDWLHPSKLAVVSRLLPHLDVLFTTHAAEFAVAALRTVGAEPPTVAFVPNCCDASVESGRAFAAQNLRHDLFFAGRVKPERHNLHRELRQLLPGRTLGLFGEKGAELLGAAYLDEIALSRCGLNLSASHDADLYSSDRLLHLAGNGTLVLSGRFARMEELFADGEVVAFDDIGELPSLLDYWLAKDRWRKVAEAGWRRAHNSYSSERVARWLLDVVLQEEKPAACEWSRELVRP